MRELINHNIIKGSIIFVIVAILFYILCLIARLKYFKEKGCDIYIKILAFEFSTFIAIYLFVNDFYKTILIGECVVCILSIHLFIEICLKDNFQILRNIIIIVFIGFIVYVYPNIKNKSFELISNLLRIVQSGDISEKASLVTVIAFIFSLYAVIKTLYSHSYSLYIQDKFGIPHWLVKTDLIDIIYKFLEEIMFLLSIALCLVFLYLLYDKVSSKNYMFLLFFMMSFLLFLIILFYVFDLLYYRIIYGVVISGLLSMLLSYVVFFRPKYSEIVMLLISIPTLFKIFDNYMPFNNKKYVIIEQNNKYYAVITITKNDKFVLIEVIDDDNKKGEFTIKNKYKYELFNKISLKNKKYRRVNAIL